MATKKKHLHKSIFTALLTIAAFSLTSAQSVYAQQHEYNEGINPVTDIVANVSGYDEFAVRVNTGATLELSGANGNVSSSGGGASYGLYAFGGVITSIGTLNVTTSGSWSPSALIAKNSGTITLSSEATTTINTLGDGAHGLSADDTGKIHGDGTITISTAGQWLAAIKASNGGEITLGDDSTVTIDTGSASGGNGVHAQSSGTVSIKGSLSVTTKGQWAQGVYAENGTITLEEGSSVKISTKNESNALYVKDGEIFVKGVLDIETEDDNSLGVAVRENGKITLSSASNTTVTTNGLNAHGFSVNDGEILSNGAVTITTDGEESDGFFVSDNGIITHSGILVVTTNNSGSRGIYADAATGSAEILLSGDIDVKTNGENGHGIYALNGGEITVDDDVNVLTSGNNAYGVVSIGAGSKVDMTDAAAGTIKTSGNGANGLHADNGTIQIANHQVSTYGRPIYNRYFFSRSNRSCGNGSRNHFCCERVVSPSGK